MPDDILLCSLTINRTLLSAGVDANLVLIVIFVVNWPVVTLFLKNMQTFVCLSHSSSKEVLKAFEPHSKMEE